MSHFSVMVVTDEEPTDKVLTKVMQPYHEFECTGTDDQYVQDIDITDECRKDYEEATTDFLEDADGGLYEPYDDQFYRDPTEEELKTVGIGSGCGNGISWTSKDWEDGRGYRPKVRFVPEGFEEVTAKTKNRQTFAEFCDYWHGFSVCDSPSLIGGFFYPDTYKYGYVLLDEQGDVAKVVRRTNPNKKWDYWRVGGRYRSKLQVKAGITTAVSTEPSWEWRDEAPPEGVDIARVADIDRDAMKSAAVKGRQTWVDECIVKSGLVDTLSFEKALHEKREAHAKWIELDEPKPRGCDYTAWLVEQGYLLTAAIQVNFENPELKSGETLLGWVESAPAVSSFAAVIDGKWYERGSMGWWGCVSDENDDWDSEFAKMFDALHDNQWVTFLDCHI